MQCERKAREDLLIIARQMGDDGLVVDRSGGRPKVILHK
jgi:hypothetical protein